MKINKFILPTIFLSIFLLFFFGFDLNDKAFLNQTFNQTTFRGDLSDEYIRDFYCDSEDFHWSHMPLTYNYNKDCLEWWGGIYTDKIKKAVDYIANKTNYSISFKKVDSHNPDIVFVCKKELGKDAFYPGFNEIKYTLAEAEPYVLEGTNLYVKGIVYIYTVETGYCKNPVTIIHEILHLLGVKHTSNPRDIMYPTWSGCFAEMSSQTSRFLESIYTNPNEKCPYILSNYETGVFDNIQFPLEDYRWKSLPVIYSVVSCNKKILKRIQLAEKMIESQVGYDLFVNENITNSSQILFYCDPNETYYKDINRSLERFDKIDNNRWSLPLASHDYYRDSQSNYLKQVNITLYRYPSPYEARDCGGIEVQEFLHGLGLRNHYGQWMNSKIELCSENSPKVADSFAVSRIKELYNLGKD